MRRTLALFLVCLSVRVYALGPDLYPDTSFIDHFNQQNAAVGGSISVTDGAGVVTDYSDVVSSIGQPAIIGPFESGGKRSSSLSNISGTTTWLVDGSSSNGVLSGGSGAVLTLQYDGLAGTPESDFDTSVFLADLTRGVNMDQYFHLGFASALTNDVSFTVTAYSSVSDFSSKTITLLAGEQNYFLKYDQVNGSVAGFGWNPVDTRGLQFMFATTVADQAFTIDFIRTAPEAIPEPATVSYSVLIILIGSVAAFRYRKKKKSLSS